MPIKTLIYYTIRSLSNLKSMSAVENKRLSHQHYLRFIIKFVAIMYFRTLSGFNRAIKEHHHQVKKIRTAEEALRHVENAPEQQPFIPQYLGLLSHISKYCTQIV
jgi:hypothetical protein